MVTTDMAITAYAMQRYQSKKQTEIIKARKEIFLTKDAQTGNSFSIQRHKNPTCHGRFLIFSTK